MSDIQHKEAPLWVGEFVDAIEGAPAVEASKAVFRRAFETATTRPVPDLPDGHLSHPVMKDIALHLDADFLECMGNQKGIRTALDREYKETSKFWDRSAKVAHIVSKYLGEDARDVACALFLRAGREDGSMEDLRVCNLDEEGKEIVIGEVQEHYQLKPGETKKILEWMLGSERFSRYHKRLGYDYEGMLKRVWMIMGRCKDIRWKVCQALRRWQMTPEKLFMASAVRQGWQHFLEAREVTEPEWWEFIREHAEKGLHRCERDRESALKIGVHVKGVLEIKKKLGKDMKVFERIKRRAERYLAKHPERPEGRQLIDMLECDELGKSLVERERLLDTKGLATLQKSIAHVCHLMLTGYGDGLKKDAAADEERDGNPSYIRGLPTEVVATKDASCFGSNWLLATLMLRSGIRPQDLTYVHANQLSHGFIAPHALLLQHTNEGEIMLVDRYDTAGREVFGGTVGPITSYYDLIDGKVNQANLYVRPEVSAIVRLPSSMVGARLFDGIAAEHMMNTGLQFFHEGKLDEAERAFLLAHAFCPLIPDILHHLGQTASRKGDNDTAKRYFEEAVQLFESDIASHFALGEIARMRGDHVEAKKRFKRVTDEVNRVWGDDDFIKKAKEYLKGYPEEPKEEYVPMYEI